MGTGNRKSVIDSGAFWSYVGSRDPDRCWEWQRARFRNGYGALCHDRRVLKAHRVAWEITHGAIPDGMLVLHRCDNPPCCNPAHLFLGTHKTNAEDRDAKGRGRTGRRFPKSEPVGSWTHAHPPNG